MFITESDSVDVKNHAIMQIPGIQHSYMSIDYVEDPQNVVHYPLELLNSLQPPGILLHKKNLMICAPITLLKYLNSPKLCNGTHLTVKQLMPNLNEATVINGCAAGSDSTQASRYAI